MLFKGSRLAIVLFALLLAGTPSLAAQNIEAGIHGGLARITDETVLGSETGPEFGVWLLLWPSERIAVAADWAFLPRDSFQSTVGTSIVGEHDRNRQYVDITLQYHFMDRQPFGVFIEAGGGSHWNNRYVENVDAALSFEEQGKESTRQGVWTMGGGFRIQLSKHIHWLNSVKLHNLGRKEEGGIRLLTGISFSLR